MKMVKSLLLGSAAGVIAVAGAQGADLPVKAKAVEYVKVCSLYGAGFYYMPGTDVCIKIGGYVRNQHYFGYGANATNTPFFSPNFQDTRIGGQHDYTIRFRAIGTMDTRQQTAYGTLRTYMIVGWTTDSPANVSPGGGTAGANIYANRAFIQLAGFTLGKASSYFDFYSAPATSYFATNSTDTGDGGWGVVAYTGALGNGVSWTLSLEEPRRLTVVSTDAAFAGTGAFNAGNVTATIAANNPFLVGGVPASDMAVHRWPDVVLNLRVDQAWGSAQIMGALHDASAGYNMAGGGGATCLPTLAATGVSLTGSAACGSAGNDMGWAVGFGARIKADAVAPGDYFQFQVNYTEGALRYLSHTQFAAGSAAFFGSNNSLGVGIVTDGVFGTLCGNAACTAQTAFGNQLTKGWSINAAYEHYWTPKLRTSIHGGYVSVDYNGTASALIAQAHNGPPGSLAAASATSCTGFQRTTSGTAATTNATLAAPGGSITNLSNCNPDFAIGFIGTRTQYNITPRFYMGVDLLYSKLYTGFQGLASYRAAGGTARPTNNTIRIEDQDTWAATIRFHVDTSP